MKLKKNKNKKIFNKVNLHLLKYKIYNNYSKKKNLNILNLLKTVNFSLKQSLKIIVNYTIKNKTILFLGFPYLNRKSHSLNLKRLNHIFLPKILWKKGFIKNKFKSKKIPELIVFFDKQNKDSLILKELENLNIPIIIFGNSTTLKTSKHYTISSNLTSPSIKAFFQVLIYSVFKII